MKEKERTQEGDADALYFVRLFICWVEVELAFGLILLCRGTKSSLASRCIMHDLVPVVLVILTHKSLHAKKK